MLHTYRDRVWRGRKKSLIKAIEENDLEYVDNYFVDEFQYELARDPYLFLTPETYWVYEYTYHYPTTDSDYGQMSEVEEDKIGLPVEMVTISNVLFDETSDEYGELMLLFDPSVDESVILYGWNKFDRKAYNDEGIFYSILLIENGMVGVLETLIENGLDINAINESDESALIQAAKNPDGVYNGTLVATLLRLGADVSYFAESIGRVTTGKKSFLYHYITNIPEETFDKNSSARPLEDYFTVLYPYWEELIPLLDREDIIIATYTPGLDGFAIERQLSNLDRYALDQVRKRRNRS